MSYPINFLQIQMSLICKRDISMLHLKISLKTKHFNKAKLHSDLNPLSGIKGG